MLSNLRESFIKLVHNLFTREEVLMSNEPTVRSSSLDAHLSGRERAAYYFYHSFTPVPAWAFMTEEDQINWVYRSKPKAYWS